MGKRRTDLRRLITETICRTETQQQRKAKKRKAEQKARQEAAKAG